MTKDHLQHSRSGKRGFIERRWILGLGSAAVISCIGLYFYLQHRNSDVCIEHLKKIYTAVGLYELESGILPELDFFPDRPKEDLGSMRVVLEKFGAAGKSLLCPSTHRLVRDTGLSYVWNIELNGRSLKDIKNPVWMLVEVNAVSSEVPPPHIGRYHILFTDGQVALSDRPPSDIADWKP